LEQKNRERGHSRENLAIRTIKSKAILWAVLSEGDGGPRGGKASRRRFRYSVVNLNIGNPCGKKVEIATLSLKTGLRLNRKLLFEKKVKQKKRGGFPPPHLAGKVDEGSEREEGSGQIRSHKVKIWPQKIPKFWGERSELSKNSVKTEEEPQATRSEPCNQERTGKTRSHFGSLKREKG